jgi:uncharacterized protein (DUF1015 family)
MACIRPLRALRYDPSRVGSLEAVLCPPYDVLSSDDEESLRARHPRNFVRLVLPREEQGLDRYRAAAATLSRWCADGTLRRDREPAFYFYEQEYRLADPAPIRRRGVFALVRLHDFAERVVLPHEQTLPTPREDRYRLLEATRAHLDPVFGLYSDPQRRIDRLMEKAALAAPLASAADSGGVTHRLWMTCEPAEIADIAAALDDRWVLIADGHHRYESALRYARSRPPADGSERPFDHVLMVLCNIEASGLTVLPIHRLIHSYEGFRPLEWLGTLERWFERRQIDLPAEAESAAQRIEQALAGLSGAGRAFAVVYGGDGAAPSVAHVLALRPGLDLESELGDRVPPELRRLDVAVVHALALERALGMSPEEQALQKRLRYAKSAAGALREVASGHAQAALLLNPTPIESVVAVTRAGLRLPPKSTFFHPKLVSGLVIHPFDA